MLRKPKAATGWMSRHMGNCLIERTREGWAASLLHSEGITGPSDFLVPFVAADGRKRRALAGRLERLLQSLIMELGDVRRPAQHEVAGLLAVPDMGPLWRRGNRHAPPGIGNWNGRGRLCPTRGQSGICYLTARTERGWLVLLRSPWGSPCGSYLVPFDKLPFRDGKWSPEFFVRPLRWHLTHLHGTRMLSLEQVGKLRAWDDEEMLADETAA